MELIGSIFLVLAVVFLVGLYVSRPFFGRSANAGGAADQVDTDEGERQRSALLAERDRILNALQDLEFDMTLGKIPAEDYPASRAELFQAGANVLRQLDAFEPQTASQVSPEKRLEAEVASRRVVNAVGAVAVAAPGGPVRRRPMPQNGDEIEEIIADRRKARQEKAAGFCPRCGKPVQVSDKFCSKCGATI